MKHHKSIDTLPIMNFIKIQETNNLAYLYELPFGDIEQIKEFPKDFEQIYLDILFEFDELKLDELRIQFEYEKADVNYLVSNDNKYLDLKLRYEAQIKKMREQKETGYNFWRELAEIEAFLKFQINPYSTCTRLYFVYRKRLIEHINIQKNG
jgi:hypothetical protein